MASVFARSANGKIIAFHFTGTPAPLPQPPAPVNVTATQNGSDIVIAWTAGTPSIQYPTSVAAYEVYQLATDGTATLIDTVVSSPITVSGWPEETILTVYVIAVGTNGVDSNQSAQASCLIPDVTAPDAPTLGGSTSNAGNALMWDANGEADFAGAELQYLSGSSWLTVSGYSPTKQVRTNFTDTAAPEGTARQYRVVVYDYRGNSATSNTVTLTRAVVDRTPPKAVTGLTAVRSGSNVNLSWSIPASSGISTVTINVSTNGGSSYTSLQTQAVGTTTYTHVSAPTSALIYQVVSTKTSNGYTATSAGASVNAVDVTAPANPTGLAATVNLTTINLAWNANSEPDLKDYRLYRSLSPSTGFTLLATIVKPTVAYADTTATLGQPNYYRLTARDASNNESGYITASATIAAPDTTPPLMPSGLAADGQSDGIHVSWTANTEPDVAGYNLYWSSSASGTYTKLVTQTGTTYTDSTVASGATRYYKVEAFDNAPTANVSPLTPAVSGTRPSATFGASPTLVYAQQYAGVGALHLDVLALLPDNDERFAATVSVNWGDAFARSYVNPRTGATVSTNVTGTGWAFAHQYDTAGVYTVIVTITHGDASVTKHPYTVSIAAIPSTWKQYWADPVSGNDANPGTLAQPKKTIAAIRSLITNNCVIWLKGSATHTMNREIVLNDRSNVVIRSYGTGKATLFMPNVANLPHFTFWVTTIGVTIRDVILESDATSATTGNLKSRGMTARGQNIALVNVTAGQLQHFINGILGDGFQGGLVLGCDQTEANSVRAYFVSAFGGHNIHLYFCTSPGGRFEPTVRQAGNDGRYNTIQYCTLAQLTNGKSGANIRTGEWCWWDNIVVRNTELASSPSEQRKFVKWFRVTNFRIIDGKLGMGPNTHHALATDGVISTKDTPAATVTCAYPRGQVSEEGVPKDDMTVMDLHFEDIAGTSAKALQPFGRIYAGPTAEVSWSNVTMYGSPGTFETV